MDTAWNLARGITRPVQAQRGRPGSRKVEPKTRANHWGRRITLCNDWRGRLRCTGIEQLVRGSG